MNRSAALFAVLVAATGLVAAFVGPCDAPTTRVATADAVRVAATPPRARRMKPASSAADDSATPDDDGNRIAQRVRVVVPVEVVDAATGRPVPGATLKFCPNGDDSQRKEFVTDDAGRAEANLPPGVPFPVTTKARGHFRSLDFVRTAALDAPQPTLRVTLAPSVALRGVVRDPDGGPAESVFVCIERADGDDAGDEFDCVDSDAAGAYEIDGLEVGASYTTWAPACGDFGESAKVTVTAGRDGAVADLRLRRPATLEFAVVDDDGRPVESLHFKVSNEDYDRSDRLRDGLITETLKPGRHVVKLWIKDHVPVVETIDIAEGATLKRRIVLTAGASIEGVVVDETGAPVDDAVVRSAAAPIDDEAPSPTTRTQEDGAFALRRLAKGANDLVVEPPSEFEPLVLHGVTAPSEHARFVVARRGTLALHVVFEDDARPAPKAKIAFHGEENGKPWDVDRPLPDDGRVAVAWPVAVRGEVGIAVDGFLPVTRSVNVPFGAAVDLGEIRLRRGASLVGVLRATGPDARSVYTLAVRGTWHGGRCTTGENGRFAFDGLAPGVVQIDVEKTRCSFRVAVPSREPVVLVVPSSVWLNATLTDAAGAPAAGRRIVVRDTYGEAVSEGSTDASGISYHSLPPGKYAVEADGGARAAVEIHADDTAVVVKLR